MKKLLTIILTITVLSGCATMSEDECGNADWYSLGVEDGQKGRTEAALSDRAQACARHNLSANPNLWREGWNQGLRDYCIPKTGLELGEEGERYQGSCPVDLEPDFLDAYESGLKYYCVPQNGYELGLEGSVYKGVCPGIADREFRRAFEMGKEVSGAEAKLDRIRNELDRVQKKLSRRDIEREEREKLTKRERELDADYRELREKLRRINRRNPYQ